MTESIANACVATRVIEVAAQNPERIAIISPLKKRWGRPLEYRQVTFGQLAEESQQVARGLIAWGVRPGMRLVLLVRFGPEFISLVLGLLQAGVTVVLVDPGMGRKKILECLTELNPDGFVAIPQVQTIRALMRRKFPRAIWNVTVGRRWGWSGITLNKLLSLGSAEVTLPQLKEDEPAAVIFTSGSTGPPKGVLYSHGIFNHQVDLIRDRYQIQPGDRDLACFPLFGLFDAVMGVTTVIPKMNPIRPASVDPRMIFDAVRRFEVNQAFGSPALWNTVVRHCQRSGDRLPELKRVLSAGAPVPPQILAGLRQMIDPDGQIYTPYGATESLPVASIESREVLGETAAQTQQGAGTCVGTLFPSMQWRVIEIVDGPVDHIQQTRELPMGEIGELMVAGPVVTREYVTRTDQNALHKVRDGDRIWHRVGDVGYVDQRGRFWFCGRKSQRVVTREQTLFTEPCEAILNAHPAVYRSALVGIGRRPEQKPVMVVELRPEQRAGNPPAEGPLVNELLAWLHRHATTQMIQDVKIYPRGLPVDIRHNSKIFREQLALWAAGQIAGQGGG